jgi:hypothetical protein
MTEHFSPLAGPEALERPTIKLTRPTVETTDTLNGTIPMGNGSNIVHLTGGFRGGRFDGYTILVINHKGEFVVASWDGASPEWSNGETFVYGADAMRAFVRRADLSTLVAAYGADA